VNRSISLETIKEMDQMGLLKRNFDRPPIKDTVTIPAGGYTIIRFIADNPGIWFFHCHLDFHSEVGMALLLKVGKDEDLPKISTDYWPQCGNFKAKYLSLREENSSKLINFEITNFFILISIIFLIVQRMN
jgi:L-ascorbate oxidase